MVTDKELIRRALMGRREGQKECTEKGIVLPCWRCEGESGIQELHTGGKPIYAVTCKKAYCGAKGCACSTQQKAIEYWNPRPAPPIGRCKDCLWYLPISKRCRCGFSGLWGEVNELSFCSEFKQREGTEGER